MMSNPRRRQSPAFPFPFVPEAPMEPMTEELPKKPRKPRRKKGTVPAIEDSRKWPKLSAADQKTITDFLAWHLVQALNGLQRAESAYRNSNRAPEFEGQLRYWQDVVKAINWLDSRVDTRLAYLLPEYQQPPTESPE